MALNCNFSDHTPSLEMNEEEKSFELCKSSSDTGSSLACNSSNAFDCNICLDAVQEPVVTLCGHLYCWPCIYKWIRINSVSEEYSNKRPQCPVCKAEVSIVALVALYGRGKDTVSYDREAANCGLAIPERPSFPLCWDRSALSARPLHLQNHRLLEGPHHPYYSLYTTFQVPRIGGTNTFQPIIEVFGEMVNSRVFGHSVTNSYNHSNSYNVSGAYTPRMRRQLMQAEQSLGRLCFFFFCCMIMCLLLF